MGIDFFPSEELCCNALREGIDYYSKSPRCQPFLSKCNDSLPVIGNFFSNADIVAILVLVMVLLLGAVVLTLARKK